MTAAPARRSSVVVAASLFVITVAVFFRVPLLPDIGRDLGLNAAGLGALGSAFALGRLLMDLPAGTLVDRVPAKALLLAAAVAVAVGSALIAATPTQPGAFAGFFIVGLGSTVALTTAQAHFALAPRQRRGVALSLFAAALLVGQTIGPAVSGLIAPAAGWRGAMVTAAAIVTILSIPLLRIRSPAERRQSQPAGAAAPVPRLVLATLYSLPAAQFAIGAAVLQTLIPIVGDAELGFGADTIGLALGLGGISRMVAALTSGRVSDRYGRRWALGPGLLVQFAGVVVFAVWAGTAAWLVTIVLLTLGSISVNVGTTILADLSESGGLGPRLGAFRFTGDLGFIAAPLLAGVLYDGFGRTTAMLPFVIFAGLVLAAALFALPETRVANDDAAEPRLPGDATAPTLDPPP